MDRGWMTAGMLSTAELKEAVLKILKAKAAVKRSPTIGRVTEAVVRKLDAFPTYKR